MPRTTSPRRACPHHALAVSAALGVAALAAPAAAQPLCGTWTPLADGFEGGARFQSKIYDMTVFDDGHGPQLYVSGEFETVIDRVHGPVRAPRLARWDGQRWSAVPGLDGPELELDNYVNEVVVIDDGSGPALYIGGYFTTAAGMAADGIARWDGRAWSTLGRPKLADQFDAVTAIAAHDFGDGLHVYVGGRSLTRSSLIDPSVYRWNGTEWQVAGDNPPADASVSKLVSFGGDLYASGSFQGTGAITAGIARFDGESWSTPLGPGQFVFSQEFWPMLPYALDGREVLVVGGRFAISDGDGIIARALASWDGERWIGLDPDPDRPAFQPTALAAFDDGSGEALFIGGGEITRSPASTIGRLIDGEIRPVLGLDRFGTYDLQVFDDGSGPALYAGGNFHVPDLGLTSLARWQPGERCRLDYFHDCVLDVRDFSVFQAAFMAGSILADFDGDGELSVFDFLAFQNAFEAGCP